MKRRVQRPAVRRRSPRFLRRSKRLVTKRRAVAPRKSRVFKGRRGRGLKMDVGMFTGGSNYTGGYGGYNIGVGSKRGYNVAFGNTGGDDPDGNAGAAAQYQKMKIKFGKYRSVHQALKKLDKRNTNISVLRFGKTERFTDPAAGFLLGSKYTDATATATDLPIHIYDLTSCVDLSALTGYTVTNVPALRQARITNATGAITFNAVAGRASDGTNSTNYFNRLKVGGTSDIFSTAGALTANLASSSMSVLEYVNAKFLFKCPTDRPGWFKITLLQISDEDILPGASTDAHNAFWQRRFKMLAYNPISHEATGQGAKGDWDGCKVLKVITRRWNPDTTTNKAVYSGEQIRVDLFARLNRFVNRRAPEGQYQATMTALDDDAYIEQGRVGAATGESNIRVFNTHHDFKGRIFMLVEGTYFDTPLASTDTPAEGSTLNKRALQYDCEIRTKYIGKGTAIVN